jgi:hypothetical protein
MGSITQSEGEITFLNYAPPHTLKLVQKNQQLLTDGPYLTHELSYMCLKFFDDSWPRVSPKSKFNVEYRP